MDIHPIVVHFPIALLTIYSGMEVFMISSLRKKLWWVPLKRFLLIAGTLGGCAAIFTGDIAADAYEQTNTMALVQMHERFAQLSIGLYALLMMREIFLLALEEGWIHEPLRLCGCPSQKFETILHRFFPSLLTPLFSTVAFIALSITGALGGAIVYGPNVDPIVSFFYHLFF
jgi:uncharacterized membrane protein